MRCRFCEQEIKDSPKVYCYEDGEDYHVACYASYFHIKALQGVIEEMAENEKLLSANVTRLCGMVEKLLSRVERLERTTAYGGDR